MTVPELRFPDFRCDWESRRLGDLAEIVSGVALPSNDILENGGRLIARGINVKSGFIARSRELDRYTNVEVQQKFIVAEGDVLVPMDGSKLGKNVAIADVRLNGAVLIQRVARIRASEDSCSSKYLFQLLFNRRFERYVYQVNSTSAIPHISLSQLSEFAIPIGEYHEQQKIAEFLTAVDEKIAKLKRKRELLEEYKRGMMQKLFSQEIRFKDDDGNDFPDWEFWRLGALTTKTGKRNKAGRDLPVYSINNKVGFNPQANEFEGLDSVERGYDTTAYKVISRNTFAYNPARVNVGSLGYSGDLHDVIISSLYVCFQSHELIDDQFLWQYFRGSEFRKEVVRKSEGGVRLYLFYENFSGIPLMLPSLTEQKKIADVLNKSDDLIASLNSQIEKAQEFKRGLLQKMFV